MKLQRLFIAVFIASTHWIFAVLALYAASGESRKIALKKKFEGEVSRGQLLSDVFLRKKEGTWYYRWVPDTFYVVLFGPFFWWASQWVDIPLLSMLASFGMNFTAFILVETISGWLGATYLRKQGL